MHLSQNPASFFFFFVFFFLADAGNSCCEEVEASIDCDASSDCDATSGAESAASSGAATKAVKKKSVGPMSREENPNLSRYRTIIEFAGGV